MDAELRERFDKTDTRNERIENKVDALTQALGRHLTESAVRDANAMSGVTEAKTVIAGHLEDHKEKRGWWAALWGGVIVAIATSLWAFFTGKKA